MEDLIIISNLNDFIFCPASIYFHKLYGSQDNLLYQSSAQINGTKAHETIDEKKYSTRKSAMMSLDDIQMQLEENLEYLEIMGIEGNAARIYFPRMFDNVQWNGRKPRIKNDYINVTLDIGYTMLFNIVDSMLQVYGFDTYYGVFHKCFYMRKSLVCDIMEPMRPIVDYEIRKAINLGQCKVDDFDVYDQRWCLKYKKNPEYIQFLMKAILEYKDDIFLYVQQYYRYFMKRRSVEEIPIFLLHKV